MLKAFRAWRVRRRHQAEFTKYWRSTAGSELVRTISTLALVELNSPVLERPCASLSASDGKLLRNAYAVALLWIINAIVVAEHTKEVGNNIVSAVLTNLMRWPHFDRAIVQKMSDGSPAVLNRMWERSAPSLHAPNGIVSPAAHIALLPGSVGLPFSTPFVPDHQLTVEALHALAAFRDSLPRKTPGRGTFRTTR
jgi:hypothetical protein